MAHAILIQNAVQSQNIDALNRNIKSAVDLDNGNVVMLSSRSAVSGEGEVFLATAADSTLTDLWMVSEPEVVLTAGKYKGLDPDIRNFYTVAGTVATASKPQIGDIITVSADAFSGARTAEGYAIPVDGEVDLLWAASAGSAFALKLLKETYVSIGTGNPTNQRVTAYEMEVVAI